MLQAKARINAVTNLRNSVFNQITELDMGYFYKRSERGCHDQSKQRCSKHRATIVNSLTVLLKEPFLILGYFFILFFISLSLLSIRYF